MKINKSHHQIKGYAYLVFVGAVCLVVGFTVGNQHVNQSLLRVAASEQKIIESCQNAVTALNTQGESCIQAYQTFRSCVNTKNCDLEKEAVKLRNLETQRTSAEEVLNQENEKIQLLMSELKSLK